MSFRTAARIVLLLSLTVAAPVALALPSQATDQQPTLLTSRDAFTRVAQGHLAVEDFTDSYHFPITSCKLNSLTREEGLRRGDIERGVVFRTDCRDHLENELNIDFGGEDSGFRGGFLDGFHHHQGTDARALQVGFWEPVQAVGFDTNYLTGHSLTIRVVRVDGSVTTFSNLSVTAPFEGSQFFGVVSDGFDIERVSIVGEGHPIFGFAFDNFSFNRP